MYNGIIYTFVSYKHMFLNEAEVSYYGVNADEATLIIASRG